MQGPSRAKRDESPEAQKLRQAVAQQGEAKQAIDIVREVGGSPTQRAIKAKQVADSTAFEVAQAYRKARLSR